MVSLEAEEILTKTFDESIMQWFKSMITNIDYFSI